MTRNFFYSLEKDDMWHETAMTRNGDDRREMVVTPNGEEKVKKRWHADNVQYDAATRDDSTKIWRVPSSEGILIIKYIGID